MFNLTRRKRIRPRSGASVQLRTQFGSASSLHSHILPQTRLHHPTVISNGAARRFSSHIPSPVAATTPPSFRTKQADAFSFTFASCERVGLRSEKSLFPFLQRHDAYLEIRGRNSGTNETFPIHRRGRSRFEIHTSSQTVRKRPVCPQVSTSNCHSERSEESVFSTS